MNINDPIQLKGLDRLAAIGRFNDLSASTLDHIEAAILLDMPFATPQGSPDKFYESLNKAQQSDVAMCLIFKRRFNPDNWKVYDGQRARTAK